MQSGARYQAILEIITEVFKDEQPADKIINDYTKARKYIGSKDRRFIVDEVWQIIRNRCKLTFDAKSDDPRKILLYYNKDRLEQVFDGSTYGLTPLTKEEQNWLRQENDEPYPDWVEAECPKWLYEKIGNLEFCKALNGQAQTDVRAHGISADELQAKLAAEGIESKKGAYSPYCLKIKERLVLNNCMVWQDGYLDVQDEASQLAAILIDAKPEHKIIDYCCGAGGKSLALSNILKDNGHILAYDIEAKRLEAIKPRMARLNVHDIELTEIIADSDKDFDRFILDAPCSGTGTWRRAPDAKFRLTEQKLYGLTKIQAELLEIATVKTKIGGRIIYITCSVLPDENEKQIEQFLAAHNEFKPVNMRELWEGKIAVPYPHDDERWLRLSPYTTNTDGFFICVLKKLG
ncbi:MAG: RsmB/NOP family class I SAM-dependent RNA methyltransferase [Alphaproteobacteria bacterium]|nr:RsmB/NOP family class I SAM-dependent RNA methyltransferase [Alphaproteobacteria bacterium]